MSVHAAHDAPRANSGESRRTTPRACTTSLAVDEHVVTPALEIRAICDFISGHLTAVGARTSGQAISDELRHAEDLLNRIRIHSECMAGFGAGAADRLREAEARRDWDGLADLRCFTGREAAHILNPLIDAIRTMDLTRVREARAKLAPWFTEYGEDLFAPHIEVGERRRRVLRAEHERWLAFGIAAEEAA